MTINETTADTIKQLLAEGYRPYEIRKVIRGCSTALIEHHEKSFDQTVLKKARAVRIEKLALEKYDQLYHTSTIIDFDKETKKCYECGEWKSFGEFGKNRTRWHGFSEECKTCACAYQKKRYVPAIPRPRKVKPPKPVPVVLPPERKKLKQLVGGAQGRAKKRGIPFNLDWQTMEIPEYCPVLPWVKITVDASDRRSALSIDRIDSSKGYTMDNVQLISMQANLMKTNSTPEEMKAFAEWALSNFAKEADCLD